MANNCPITVCLLNSFFAFLCRFLLPSCPKRYLSDKWEDAQDSEGANDNKFEVESEGNRGWWVTDQKALTNKTVFFRATEVSSSTTNLKKSLTNNVCLLFVIFGLLEPFDRFNYQGNLTNFTFCEHTLLWDAGWKKLSALWLGTWLCRIEHEAFAVMLIYVWGFWNSAMSEEFRWIMFRLSFINTYSIEQFSIGCHK